MYAYAIHKFNCLKQHKHTFIHLCAKLIGAQDSAPRIIKVKDVQT